MNDYMFPSRTEAEELLIWADKQNPGPWSAHSRVVARAAETIAKKCGLNGRYESARDLYHIYAGYELMSKKNYNINARICLTHSFPYQDLRAYSGNNFDCSDSEIKLIKSTLAAV